MNLYAVNWSLKLGFPCVNPVSASVFCYAVLFHSTSLVLWCKMPFVLFLQGEHCWKEYVCMYEDYYVHFGETIFKTFKRYWSCGKQTEVVRIGENHPVPPAFGSRLPLWCASFRDTQVRVSYSTDIPLHSEDGIATSTPQTTVSFDQLLRGSSPLQPLPPSRVWWEQKEPVRDHALHWIGEFSSAFLLNFMVLVILMCFKIRPVCLFVWKYRPVIL